MRYSNKQVTVSHPERRNEKQLAIGISRALREKGEKEGLEVNVV